MPFQMRFRILATRLRSLIGPAGTPSADTRGKFEICYKN